MKEKNKKGFNIPGDIYKLWEEFHSPNKKNYSPSVAGAMLVWMILPADVREIIIDATEKCAGEDMLSTAWKAILEGMKGQILHMWQIGFDANAFEKLMRDSNFGPTPWQAATRTMASEEFGRNLRRIAEETNKKAVVEAGQSAAPDRQSGTGRRRA